MWGMRKSDPRRCGLWCPSSAERECESCLSRIPAPLAVLRDQLSVMLSPTIWSMRHHLTFATILSAFWARNRLFIALLIWSDTPPSQVPIGFCRKLWSLPRNVDDVANILAYCRELSRVVVHPTCSMNHLGISAHLSKIASSFAVEAEVPVGDTCRGTAGDGGLLHPELVMSATRDTKAVLDTRPADAYISANRTCEMGFLHARGRPYRSFVFLREELGRPERPSRFNNQDIDAAIPIMS